MPSMPGPPDQGPLANPWLSCGEGSPLLPRSPGSAKAQDPVHDPHAWKGRGQEKLCQAQWPPCVLPRGGHRVALDGPSSPGQPLTCPLRQGP